MLWVGREIQPALRSWLLEDGAGALMWSPNTAQQVILPHKTALKDGETSTTAGAPGGTDPGTETSPRHKEQDAVEEWG